MLTQADLKQIKEKGITEAQINQQLDHFKTDFPPIQLVEAATLNNGILRFNDSEIDVLLDYYKSMQLATRIVKFVPASGAASRMFKKLFEFKNNYRVEKKADFFKDKGINSIHYFFANLSKFAFFSDLEDVIEENGHSLDELLKNESYVELLDYLLSDKGLNYSELPKALLKFHSYEHEQRYALEEHFVEGAKYCTNDEDEVNLHFTVSKEHKEKFEEVIAIIRKIYEQRFDITYHFSLSVQKPSTDIIAVDLKNNPFRDKEGNLLFRPGGHGALIENLNELEEELVFIKNIDNIVPDKLREPTYTYKKLIAAHLLKLQYQSFEYIKDLDQDTIAKDLIEEIEAFAKEQLGIRIEKKFTSFDERKECLIKKLNRPIRVCGMVKNEGEPGGGPFWVRNEKGEISLQIVEASQIDIKNAKQKEILSNASHFNPVDLVCGIHDHNGEKFDLKQFVDPNTGFISEKTQNGNKIKAQELPGLWNGAMADWITIFVECPIETFNPVKTVNDLLREQHQ